MKSLLQVVSPGLVGMALAMAAGGVWAGRGLRVEIPVHAALVVAAAWVAGLSALNDYHADSGADALLVLAVGAALVLGTLGEVVGHFVLRSRLDSAGARGVARYLLFAVPALLVLALGLWSQGAQEAKRGREQRRVQGLELPQMLAEVEKSPGSHGEMARVIAARPGGSQELLAAAEGGVRRQAAIVLLTDVAPRLGADERRRAVAVARVALSVVEERRAAVDLSLALAEPSLAADLRAALPSEKEEYRRRAIAHALIACGDLAVLGDVVAGRLDLQDAPDAKSLGPDAPARAERLLSDAKEPEFRVRAVRVLGWVGDPGRKLDAMAFDRSEADEVRKTAFEAWPCRDTELDLKGEALLARARSRGGGAAASAQMILLLYRRAEIDEARAATGKLGPEARDFLIAESADPVRVLRERAIALLGGCGGDPAAFAALQKLASDRAVPTELRADALESLAAVDAARAVPIADALEAENLNHASIESAVARVRERARKR